MSSGLYVSPKDRPWNQPGVGHGSNMLICSKCHLKKPSMGGGTIKGRWYGACCKPAKLAKVAKVVTP